MTTKNKMMRTFASLAAGAGVFGLVGVAQATQIVTAQTPILANGGDVSVTFVSASAADTDLSFLSSPSKLTLFDNQPNNQTPTSINLGTFGVGQLLTFELDNISIPEIFFTGLGSQNPDGDIHASVSETTSGGVETYLVGFEDLDASNSDWDYNDFVFDVTVDPVNTKVSPAPDASSTLPLLGMSLAGLAALTRRFKK
jgi:Domain of unknown function (DUF4114)